MNLSRLFGCAYFFVVLALVCHQVNAVPKQYEASSENSSNNWRRRAANDSDALSTDRTQRLGHLQGSTTAYGNSLGYGGYGSGYGGLGTSFGKGPIDLGGVVLGTLIGIGALLILPKIVGVFAGHAGGSYGSGGYYRTADETGVSEMLNRFDSYLAQQNVDSNACMQKAVCHYVRSADYHSNVGTADQIESMISTISENSIVDYMLEGTAMKEAIANAKNPNGRDCDAAYPACPLDRQEAINMVRKFLPFAGSSGSRPTETKKQN